MSVLALLNEPWQLERDITNRVCCVPTCITILCYLNPGPRCFIHEAKHHPPLYLASEDWQEQERLDELLKLPPEWKAA